MGAGLGPYIHQSNLKFGFDTGYGYADNGVGTRTFAGEPTTNLLPNSSNNGRFTTSNGWATYNTNQYNGAQYFSIGTIGSVTDNIVTLSSVGRTIRSFDVLRPQTTGGGVTAGTDYVIKKLSSNTFSLHAYNGSQNGSQGYTNPTTQFFKVHDAYALDQRVSINASSFPTMWWGAPHLPNSGLIKEIVEGGGRVPGTNCMRLHVYRGDGVADGMAYGVNTPVTAGDIITVSYWQRTATSNIAGKYLGYSTYFGPGYGAGSGGFTSTTTNEWEFVSHQWTASNTYSFISYFWPQGSGDVYAIDICDMQVEVNKGHATPFVAGTRSSTESLKDVSLEPTSIDTSNLSFDSNGQPYFDGTNDYISLPSNTNLYANEWTWEMVVKFNGNSGTYQGLVWAEGATGGGSGYQYLLTLYNYSYFHYRIQNASTGWANTNVTINFTPTNYNHIVWQFNNGTTRIYVNGSLLHTDTSRGAYTGGTSSPLYIGCRNDLAYDFNGEMKVLRQYTQTLSAEEIQQNYRGYKKRFNLS